MKFPLNLHARSGILMPALSYRFRVLFDDDENSDLSQLLTQQIVSCESNYVKKETKIVIREPYNHIISKLVLRMCENRIDIQIQELDGTNTVCFSSCILKNHKVKYDYASSDYVRHVLTFKATSIKAVDEYPEGALYFEDVLILE